MQRTYMCSKCGQILDMYDIQQDFTIHKRVGYGSIYDGDTVDLHLCCRCFDNLVRECLVYPIHEGAGT